MDVANLSDEELEASREEFMTARDAMNEKLREIVAEQERRAAGAAARAKVEAMSPEEREALKALLG